MKRVQIFLIAMLLSLGSVYAQELGDMNLEQLKSLKGEKEGVKKGIDEEIANIDKLIKEFPGWARGFGGTLGVDFGGASNWYANDIETVSSRGFGFALNTFANLNAEKFFWHNSANAALNVGTAKNKDLDDNTGVEDPEEEITSKGSLFTLGSLAGRQIFSKLYASGEARYETTLLSFNDPGTLTFSLGVTWKPINNLTVVIHPLGYQLNFPSKDLASSTGAKIGANYTGELYRGIKWTSELNAFLAYSGDDDATKPFGPYSSGDLSNWTWLNTFAVADVFKGIGVGLTLGLRNNKQLGFAKNVSDPGLQTFYTVGLSYALTY